jgi:hypothetical protein
MAAALDSIAGHIAQASENARLIAETEDRLTQSAWPRLPRKCVNAARSKQFRNGRHRTGALFERLAHRRAHESAVRSSWQQRTDGVGIMFKLNNLKFGTKILLLGIGSVLITIVALVGTVVWQSGQFYALAQEQFAHAAEADLGHIVEGAYNVVEAQDQVVQEQANSGLNVAQLLVHDAGGAKLADEKVDWQATNEATQQTMNVQLPKMTIGDTWLGKMTGRYDTTPIVDHTQLIVGGNATIYQRMNEQGDMLRVATNVLLPNGQRAIGTYVPATNPDGTPNPAIAAILRNSIYYGSNFIIDAWYNATLAPIRDESGQVIGMLQVGMKQENVDAARQAVLRAKVGETGNVDVLGSDGNNRGRYIISRKGQRDGESVWDTQSANGSFPIQSLIEKAVALKFGEVAIERYQWQDQAIGASLESRGRNVL